MEKEQETEREGDRERRRQGEKETGREGDRERRRQGEKFEAALLTLDVLNPAAKTEALKGALLSTSMRHAYLLTGPHVTIALS
jgi:hypothetical protein